MSLNIVSILDLITSHAMSTAAFETVQTHEPKSAPGNGMSLAVWAQNIGPARGSSGLSYTSVKIDFNVRIYQNFISQPEDQIDPMVVNAVDLLLAEYSGDFELGGYVRQVDLLGQFGDPLSARAGYIQMDNSKMYRTMTINLPVVVNDVWSQSG